jgi:hypothetical protein
MPIRTIIEGQAFRIYAWEKSNSCETLDFLKHLQKYCLSDHKRILAILKFTSESGPSRNPQQCRSLEGDHARGLYEFKAPAGARLIWFYDKNQIIICSHGFIKKQQKTPNSEIYKAQSIRQEYLKEKEK